MKRRVPNMKITLENFNSEKSFSYKLFFLIVEKKIQKEKKGKKLVWPELKRKSIEIYEDIAQSTGTRYQRNFMDFSFFFLEFFKFFSSERKKFMNLEFLTFFA